MAREFRHIYGYNGANKYFERGYARTIHSNIHTKNRYRHRTAF